MLPTFSLSAMAKTHQLCIVLQDVPVADAKPEDIQDLLGGALFKVRPLMESDHPSHYAPLRKPWLSVYAQFSKRVLQNSA